MSTARKSRAPGPGAAMRRISIRVAGLRGVQRLANDATVAVTDLVEAMHDAVLLTPGVLARRIDGRTPGIAMNCRDATLTAAFRCSNAGSAPVVWSWSPSIRASNVRADSTASRPEASRHRGDHAAPGLRVHGHEPRPQDDRGCCVPECARRQVIDRGGTARDWRPRTAADRVDSRRYARLPRGVRTDKRFEVTYFPPRHVPSGIQRILGAPTAALQDGARFPRT
jgi:hypothetical protein